jgi:GNAT superfamily N-acetyltransferase
VPSTRRATARDRRTVVQTVLRAFSHDPAWAFMIGADYDRLAPLMAGALFDQRVAEGTVWLCDEGAAVAMWDAPGRHGAQDDDRAAAWHAFHEVAGPTGAAAMARYDAALFDVAPTEPHWYLGVLATDPSRQGSGLATAVMAPGMQRADADGLACCLETSTLANRAFYERRGFTQATPVVIEGGPPTWWMTRPVGAGG